MNAHLQPMEISDKDDGEPFRLSRKKRTEHSHVTRIESPVDALPKSGEYSVQTNQLEQHLLDEARYELHQIRNGNKATPIISVLAEERLERIISTLQILHGMHRAIILFHIDYRVTETDLRTWLLRNRLAYCRQLLTQDIQERTKRSYTGWQRRTLEQQIHTLRHQFSDIELSPFLIMRHFE